MDAIEQFRELSATGAANSAGRQAMMRSRRPQMRFVLLKTAEQQSILAVHRVRASFVKARTAWANQIRGIMGEFGLTLPQGIGHVLRSAGEQVGQSTLANGN